MPGRIGTFLKGDVRMGKAYQHFKKKKKTAKESKIGARWPARRP
jgi:hypothetical protein